MRNILIAAATAAALAAGSAAFANSFYVSPQIGIGNMDTQKSSTTDALQNYDIGGFAYRLDAGYQFNMDQNFDLGAEVGYVGYADNKYNDGSTNNMKYEGHYFDLLGVAKYNINPDWNVFAKLGPAFVSQKTSGTYRSTAGIYESKSRVKAELAVGGAYNFNQNVSLNLNIYHVFGNKPDKASSTVTKDNLNKTASVSTLLLGLQYNFS